MKALFELEWNDDLSEGWMNKWNLELCLHSKSHSKKELVRVTKELSGYEIAGESYNPKEHIHEIILHKKNYHDTEGKFTDPA